MVSREWQQTKMRHYVLPDAVYYQSIWAVRDLHRMESRLLELENQNDSFVCDGGSESIGYRGSLVHPREKDILERRIGEIYAALESIPEDYRSVVLQNIVLRSAGQTSLEDWRYWKQRFLYNVAKNLSLI